jgi:NTE family protein
VEGRPPPETRTADGIFEGGGVKGIAFVGALEAARELVGIEEWVNVAGTSAGAIVAALLAAGYPAEELESKLPADYGPYADYGLGGRYVGGAWNLLFHRGMARGRAFEEWLGDLLEESPLRDRDATFARLERSDLPADIAPEQREAARFRLRVIASDLTAGRMLVLPQDIAGYRRLDGEELQPETLKVAEAVRMSMSFPFFFEPVRLLDEKRHEHLIVDGGLLSNYPIWLFDNPGAMRRYTWGFRLQPGGPHAEPALRSIRGPFWEARMARAIMHATMSAWDDRAERSSRVRTIDIPTGRTKTLKFKLGADEVQRLKDSGYAAATEFFRSSDEYVNSFGQTAPAPLVSPR